MNLYDILREFVRIFERMNCPYAVMGGLAVRVYGIPRPTQDVDFTAAIPRTRLEEFYVAAEAAGYTIPEVYHSGWVDQVAEMPVIKLRRHTAEHGIDVDLFLAESRFQSSIMSRRVAVDLDGHATYLVSPEDLILLKLIAGRKRDLADVGDVLFTQGALDTDYMRRWASELGISDRLETAITDPEWS